MRDRKTGRIIWYLFSAVVLVISVGWRDVMECRRVYEGLS